MFVGRRVRINIEPEMSDAAQGRYLSAQGRFRKAGLDAGRLRMAIDEEWKALRLRARDSA